jgi:hypothetical protein
MNFTPHMNRVVSILGEDRTYTPVSGIARTVRAEFVNPPADFINISGNKPMVICAIADVATPKEGDTWMVNGIAYSAMAPRTNTESGLHEIALELA